MLQEMLGGGTIKVYWQHASIRERGRKEGHFSFALWEAHAPFSGVWD